MKFMNRRQALKKLAGVTVLAAALRPNARLGADGRLSDLPDWVPMPGAVGNISLNTLADLDPCPRYPCTFSAVMGQRGMFAFSGGAYAEDYGRYGAYVMTGGGHGDYHGNEIYLFPFEERKWLRLTDPYPSNGLRKGKERGAPSVSLNDLKHSWPEFDPEFGDYAGSIPEQMHTYDFVDVLPKAAGGGKMGSLIRLIGTASGSKAYNFAATHVCDLATGTWKRYARAKRAGVAGGSAFDPRRKRFYMVVAASSSPSASVYFLDTQSRVWNEQRLQNRVPVVIESSATLYPPGDLFVYVQTSTSDALRLWALPLELSATVRWLPLRTEGTPPKQLNGSSRGFGLEFCPLDRCFYGIPGGGETRLWKLIPPEDDAVSGTWHWEAQDLKGAIDVGRGRLLYNRMRWVQPLQSFAFIHGINGPMQLIRPHV